MSVCIQMLRMHISQYLSMLRMHISQYLSVCLSVCMYADVCEPILSIYMDVYWDGICV